jgi:hypothetical protein
MRDAGASCRYGPEESGRKNWRVPHSGVGPPSGGDAHASDCDQENGRQFCLLRVSSVQNEFSAIRKTVGGCVTGRSTEEIEAEQERLDWAS